MRRSNFFRAVTASVMLLAIAVLVTPAASAATITDMRDSTAFNYQYTGADLATSPDWPGYNGSTRPAGVAEGDYLRYNVGTMGGLYAWTNSLSEATGWTVEFSMQVTAAGSPIFPSVYTIFASEGLANQYNYINVAENAVYAGQGLVELHTTLATKDMTDGFHTVRIAQAPNSGLGDTHVWVDGELVADDLSGLSYELQILALGKGNGNMNQGECLIEYINIDTTGGYAPVPEPSTLALLAAAAFGLLLVQRKK